MDSMDVQTHRICADDTTLVPYIAEVFQAMQEEGALSLHGPVFPQTPEMFLAQCGRGLADSQLVGFVHTGDSRPAGITWLHALDYGAMDMAAPWTGTFILPEYRGKPALRMSEQLCALCVAPGGLGFPQLLTATLTSNRLMRTFLRSAGWGKVGTYPKYSWAMQRAVPFAVYVFPKSGAHWARGYVPGAFASYTARQNEDAVARHVTAGLVG